MDYRVAMDHGEPISPASTFLFADIAGFTALTEAHGDEDAADLAVDFCARVTRLLAPGDGEVVKTIGDALMVRLEDASTAVRLGLAIAHDVMADHGDPTIRVGMHSGPATARDGDYFGATVNLAARVAGAAAGGEVLVSDEVRRRAQNVGGVTFVSRGLQRVRNVARPVELYAAQRAAGVETVERILDPVCHMAMVPGQEARRVEHGGAVFLFCSELCADRFVAAPADYVT